MSIQVELRITGLAVLDTVSRLVHLVDATKAHGDHQHFPEISFRPDDYTGKRWPKTGSTELFRAARHADFLTAFPLQGEISIGTANEVKKKKVGKPKLGKKNPPTGLGSLDEIISRAQLSYSGLSADYPSKCVASIRLIGGTFWAAKRILDKNGNPQKFEAPPGSGNEQHFCDHIVWRRTVPKKLVVLGTKPRLVLGLKQPLVLSITNLPRRGWLGPGKRYFSHLGMLKSLGVAQGTFKKPKEVGGSISAGSESCSPTQGP